MTGQLVTSTAGHDKGNIYIIIDEDENFLYLCDGKTKNQDNPKKKRKKHAEMIYAFAQDSLRNRLKSGERVYPEEFRTTIKQYKNLKINKM